MGQDCSAGRVCTNSALQECDRPGVGSCVQPGPQPLTPTEELLMSGRDGDVEGIQRALRQGAKVDARVRLVTDPSSNPKKHGYHREDGFKVCRRRGLTALMYAALEGHADATRYLLDQGASPLMEDEDGLRVLHFAAMCGSPDICRLIVGAGGKPGDLDDFGRTAIDYVPAELLKSRQCRSIWEEALEPASISSPLKPLAGSKRSEAWKDEGSK